MSVVEAASPHLRDFLRVKDDDGGVVIGAGFILGTVVSSDKHPSPLHSRAVSVPPASRTLLDIIRDEEPNASPCKRSVGQGQGHHGKDRKSWKSFKDRLRLRRTGTAGTLTYPVPSSHFGANTTCRSPGSAPFNSGVRVLSDGPTQSENSTSADDEARNSSGPTVTQRNSTRFGNLVPISIEPARSSDSPERSLRPQISRQNSTRYTSQLTRSPGTPAHSESNIAGVRELEATMPADDPPRQSTRRLSAVLAEERYQAAREASSAEEAAVAEQPVRMTLMDLLEDTDRQMGLEGTRYSVVGEDEEATEEEEGGGGGVEQNCCICMVRHKGAAFIPCGHTFCRLCSRELWVSRGNCPLCNNYIFEILDIF